MIVDDLMRVNFSGDWERDEALHGVIESCFSAALGSKQMLTHCPNEIVQLRRALQAVRRYGEVCEDTLKAILTWESQNTETLRSILDNCIFEGELASQELVPYRRHHPNDQEVIYQEVKFPTDLPDPVKYHVWIGIDRCVDLFVACFLCCEEFIRVWIDPDAIW